VLNHPTVCSMASAWVHAQHEELQWSFCCTYCMHSFCCLIACSSVVHMLSPCTCHNHDQPQRHTVAPAAGFLAACCCWLSCCLVPTGLTTGHRIPDATPINLGLHTAAQQDPRWVGAQGELAPSVFNPGRMLTPEGQKQGWLMPFGAGPRFCVGEWLTTATTFSCSAVAIACE
jgi:hypothetical protein